MAAHPPGPIPAAPSMPPGWPARIRALAAGELTPPVPRPAATVVLLRDTADGPQAYLLRRRTSMAFAGGMYAFPGGGVDPRDAEAGPRWAGPSPRSGRGGSGCDPATARALVCAAVRETFEESGVLLAGPDADTSSRHQRRGLGAPTARRAGGPRALLRRVLPRRGLVLRSDLLGAWARWITPAFEDRRYDTWFFVAALPAGQRAARRSARPTGRPG